MLHLNAKLRRVTFFVFVFSRGIEQSSCSRLKAATFHSLATYDDTLALILVKIPWRIVRHACSRVVLVVQGPVEFRRVLREFKLERVDPLSRNIGHELVGRAGSFVAVNPLQRTF